MNQAEVTIKVSGSSRADLYCYRDLEDFDDQDDEEASHSNGNNHKSGTFTAGNGDAEVWFRIYAEGGATGSLSYTATGPMWSDMTPSGNTSTSALQQAELQNFANWYQYHRTRNKMAKAGASEAFGRLGANYDRKRVV